MSVERHPGLPVRVLFLALVAALLNIPPSPSTLRVYRNGEYTDYAGPRKADGIVSYMVKYVSCRGICNFEFLLINPCS